MAQRRSTTITAHANPNDVKWLAQQRSAARPELAGPIAMSTHRAATSSATPGPVLPLAQRRIPFPGNRKRAVGYRGRSGDGGLGTQERLGGAAVPRIPSLSRIKLMKLTEDIAIDNLRQATNAVAGVKQAISSQGAPATAPQQQQSSRGGVVGVVPKANMTKTAAAKNDATPGVGGALIRQGQLILLPRGTLAAPTPAAGDPRPRKVIHPIDLIGAAAAGQKLTVARAGPGADAGLSPSPGMAAAAYSRPAAPGGGRGSSGASQLAVAAGPGADKGGQFAFTSGAGSRGPQQQPTRSTNVVRNDFETEPEPGEIPSSASASMVGVAELEEGELLPGQEPVAPQDSVWSNLADLEKEMVSQSRRLRRTRRRRDGFDRPTPSTYVPIGGKTYWCWVCSQIFYTRYEHKDHLAKEHDMDVEYGKWMRDGDMVRSYECTECGMQFKWPSALMNHYNQSHAPQYNLPFKCPTCGWGFALMGNLQKHEKAVHGPDRPTAFLCEQCDSGYASKKEYHKHLHRVHNVPNDKKKHYCPVCADCFMSRGEYVKHVSKEHPDTPAYVCFKCAEMFEQPSQFLEHRCLKRTVAEMRRAQSARVRARADAVKMKAAAMRQVGGGAEGGGPGGKQPKPNNPDYAEQPFYPYKCTICGQLFQHAKRYDRHMQERHVDNDDDGSTNESKKARLDRQAAELLRQQGVDGDVSTSTDEDALDDEMDGCRGCRRGFKTNAAFQRHMRRCHSKKAIAKAEAAATDAESGEEKPKKGAGTGGGDGGEDSEDGDGEATEGVTTDDPNLTIGGGLPSAKLARSKAFRPSKSGMVGRNFTSAKFQCPDCGDFFVNFDDLTRHRTRRNHWGDIPPDLLGMMAPPGSSTSGGKPKKGSKGKGEDPSGWRQEDPRDGDEEGESGENSDDDDNAELLRAALEAEREGDGGFEDEFNDDEDGGGEDSSDDADNADEIDESSSGFPDGSSRNYRRRLQIRAQNADNAEGRGSSGDEEEAMSNEELDESIADVDDDNPSPLQQDRSKNTRFLAGVPARWSGHVEKSSSSSAAVGVSASAGTPTQQTGLQPPIRRVLVHSPRKGPLTVGGARKPLVDYADDGGSDSEATEDGAEGKRNDEAVFI